MYAKFGISMVAAIAAMAVTVSGAQARERKLVPDRIVVKLKKGAGTAELGTRLSSLGCRVRRSAAEAGSHANPLEPDAADTVKLEVSPTDRERVLNELAARTDVRFAAPVYLYAPEAVPNDPRFTSQYHHTLMGSPAAWDVTQGSSSIKIAILDTGVDSDHPDLVSKLLPGFNAFSNNTNSEDVEGHGTAVAGCAAAATNNGVGVAGMSWLSPIIPVRISDAEGSAPSDAIADGIRWAADNGAKVINISFGPLQDDTVILNAAGYARNRGALVFASMGNDGRREPAPENANIVFVGATTSSDAAASFTTFGPSCRLSAPGVSIPSTVRGGTYGNWSGTSFSSPIAAGAAALVWSANPSATPAEVENALFTTAKDLGASGRDETFGFGRIDVAAAVNRIRTTSSGPAKADLTSPAPGGTLPSSTVTFQWTAGTQAQGYWLYVGTEANSSQYFNGQLTGTSQAVGGLPLDGSTVRVVLYTQLGGAWYANNYSFTAGTAAALQKAVLTSPAPGSTLSATSVTFKWSAGQGATGYFLYVGTAANSSQYFGAPVGTSTQQTVSGLPADGSSIRVVLYTELGGVYQPNEYTVQAMAAPAQTKAVLTSPTPGSTLSGSQVTFRWNAGNGATSYFLYAGTDAQTNKYFGAEVGNVTSQTVSGLPNDGSTVKVWLYSLLNGTWQANIYTFTAQSPQLSSITSPAPGTTLFSSTVTFQWSNVGSQYWLYVGTPTNSSAYFTSYMNTTRSQTVPGLPRNGSTVRVWIYTLINGAWVAKTYDYISR